VVEPEIPLPTTHTSTSSLFSGPANRSPNTSPKICKKGDDVDEEEEEEEAACKRVWVGVWVFLFWRVCVCVCVCVAFLKAGVGRWKAWVLARRRRRRRALWRYIL
jgi:hypothetical protein